MHAVILQDAKLAAEIVANLNENKLGQAALAIPNLAPMATGQKSALPEGALAWAIDKVHAPDELRAIVTNLLANVVIVRDLDSALQLKSARIPFETRHHRWRVYFLRRNHFWRNCERGK